MMRISLFVCGMCFVSALHAIHTGEWLLVALYLISMAVNAFAYESVQHTRSIRKEVQ
jgi:hypothetical protein